MTEETRIQQDCLGLTVTPARSAGWQRPNAAYLASGGDVWREWLAALCVAHVGLRPAGLILFDVTTFYFETDTGDGFREPGFSKELRLEPQTAVGVLSDASGFPLMVSAFEGNKAETTTMLLTITAFMAVRRLADLTIVADAAGVTGHRGHADRRRPLRAAADPTRTRLRAADHSRAHAHPARLAHQAHMVAAYSDFGLIEPKLMLAIAVASWVSWPAGAASGMQRRHVGVSGASATADTGLR